MKKILLIAIGISIFSINAFAQQKPATKNLGFHSINEVGLLEGQKGSAFQLETINGLQWKSWFAGVGVGLDYYRYRSVPLFVDVRKEFGKNRNKFFLYGDAGINFSWATDKQKMPYVANDKFNNGFYASAGGGYKIAIKQKSGIVLSIAYSYKKSEETNTTYYYFVDPGFGPNISPLQRYDYKMNRIAIKVGWEF